MVIVAGRRIGTQTLLLALAALGYIALSLVTLGKAPLVWMDEPWYTQPAWSFAQHGTFAAPMFPGLDGFETSNLVYGRIYLVGVAGFFKLFGLGAYQARLLSLVAGLVAIGLTYFIGRRLWDHRGGIVAAVALAASPVFWFQSHDARPEIVTLMFLLGCLALVLQSEHWGSTKTSLLAGVVGGLAADTHLNGLIVPFVAGTLLVFRQPSRPRLWLTFGVGVVASWGWWFAVHVLPNPDLFVAQASTLSPERLPLLDLPSDPAAPVIGEIGRFWIAAFGWWDFAWVVPAVGVLAAIVLIAYRRDRAAIALAAATVTTMVLLTFVVANKSPRYAVALWPMAALMLARWSTATLPKSVGAAAVGITVGLSSLSVALGTSSTWAADYDGYAAKLRSYVAPGAVVESQPTYWYAFADRPFVADHLFKSFPSYETEVRALGVEYVVADELFLTTQLELEKSIDADQVHAFLRDHATLVAEVEDPFYGAPDPRHSGPFVTRIYKVSP